MNIKGNSKYQARKETNQSSIPFNLFFLFFPRIIFCNACITFTRHFAFKFQGLYITTGVGLVDGCELELSLVVYQSVYCHVTSVFKAKLGIKTGIKN